MNINTAKSIRVLLALALTVCWVSLGPPTLAQNDEDARAGRATSIIVNPSPGTPVISPIQPTAFFKVDLSAAASQPSYYSGEPIVLDLTLTNRSGSAVGLSGMILGNIVLTSIQRDGTRVLTVVSESSFGDGFGPELDTSLVKVPKNGTLNTEWRSSHHDDLFGDALLTSQYTANESTGASLFHSLAQAGTYTLTFHYKYKGPTSSFSGTVFKGKTNSVTVTFTVM